MKGKANHSKGADGFSSLRIPYFYCTSCRARQQAVDEGEVHPVCAVCGHRSLELRHESNEVSASPTLPEPVPVLDERPEEAAPFVRTGRIKSPRELALGVLRELVTDLPAGIENPETSHALLRRGVFNSFTRELVNHMVIYRVAWRVAMEEMSQDFYRRYDAELQEFEQWAMRTAALPEETPAFPQFLEPNTNHDATRPEITPDAPP